MSLKMRPTLLMVFLALATGCSETETIEEGEFRFLRISATKHEVLQSIAAAGISDLRPVPDTVIVVKRSDPSRLSELYDREGVVLSDHSGFSVQLGFDEGKTKVKYTSYKYRQGDSYFYDGQDKSAAFDMIANLLKKIPDLLVWNFLPDSRWVKPQSIDSAGLALLKKYDTWKFSGIQDYSSYRLTFENDKLIRIVFTWSYGELP